MLRTQLAEAASCAIQVFFRQEFRQMSQPALLAPVPEVHLNSAEGEVIATGKSYVSFGSSDFTLFRKLDEQKKASQIPVYIYPSKRLDGSKTDYRVRWIGWYAGSTEDMDEKLADEENGHRPPSTSQFPEDNASGHAVFWRVANLQRLPEETALPLSDFTNFRSGKGRGNSPPHGPEIVQIPMVDSFPMPTDSVTKGSAVLTGESNAASPMEVVAMPDVPPFDPQQVEDDRQKRLVSINDRRGQSAFRRKLLTIYGGRCAVTGWDVAEALEAAHIFPFSGDATQPADNGILLRADIHTLFDLGLLGFDPDTYSVVLAPSLSGSSIQALAGKKIILPDRKQDWPSCLALRWHLSEKGLSTGASETAVKP